MSTTPTHTPEQSYPYVDEHGELLFTVHRWPGKKFSQQPADGRTGAGAMRGVRLVPYRLPTVIAAATAGRGVYVVEGERDVHSAESAGVVATCNPGGALKWRKEYAAHFRGVSTVVIVADRDDAGTEHARNVAASLDEIANCVTVQAAIGKDLSDHLAAGLTLDQLVPFMLPPPPALEPRRQPARSRPGSGLRHDPTYEALKAIDTAAYFWLLCGRELDSRGFALCPIHDERTPSFHARDRTRWKCFGCSRSGDIFDLAQALWGHTRFPEVRARLVDAVMRGGADA